MKHPLPKIPLDLVIALNKRFPDRRPDQRHTDREIWMAAGARQVVDVLIAEAERQHQVELETTSVFRTAQGRPAGEPAPASSAP